MTYKIPSYDDIPDAALPAISSAMPAEDALAAYERHQDAQPEITDKMIEGVANLIEQRLLKPGKGGSEYRTQQAINIFTDRISDALVDFGEEEEDGISLLVRMAMDGRGESEYEMGNIGRAVVLEMARDHYDDFCFEASCWGYLDH